ncbi:MAG: heavy metal sensor histidine kinase [Ignavibacteriaceae bacterium]
MPSKFVNKLFNILNRTLSPVKSSMKFRLIFLFTSFTFGVLLISNLILYRTITNNLAKEDNDFLNNKINVISLILSREGTGKGLEEEIIWEGKDFQYTKYFASVKDNHGSLIMETPQMSEILPDSVFPNPSFYTGAFLPGYQLVQNNNTYLLLSVYKDLPSPISKTYLIQVALDISSEKKVLTNYYKEQILILMLGLVLIVVIGIFITKRSLKPLDKVTSAAEKITTSDLGERIGSINLPRELHSLANAFDEMLNRLEDSFKRLSQFSADIAHELKNPINNLMGEGEIALSKPRTNDEYRLVIESSLEEYRRIAKMIEALLFLARKDNSEIMLNSKPIDVKNEIDELFSFYESIIDEKKLTINCHGNINIMGDPVLVRQVLNNVISNAVNYSSINGKIDVILKEQDNGKLEVQVSDNGIGIPKENLSKIFDRFYRTDSSRSVNPNGIGLGLSMVKSIMELHQGSVKIESELNKGTTVTLIFPQ